MKKTKNTNINLAPLSKITRITRVGTRLAASLLCLWVENMCGSAVLQGLLETTADFVAEVVGGDDLYAVGVFHEELYQLVVDFYVGEGEFVEGAFAVEWGVGLRVQDFVSLAGVEGPRDDVLCGVAEYAEAYFGVGVGAGGDDVAVGDADEGGEVVFPIDVEGVEGVVGGFDVEYAVVDGEAVRRGGVAETRGIAEGVPAAVVLFDVGGVEVEHFGLCVVGLVVDFEHLAM